MGEVFQAVDEEGISKEEAEKRIRKILEEFEAKLFKMIPKLCLAEKLKRQARVKLLWGRVTAQPQVGGRKRIGR